MTTPLARGRPSADSSPRNTFAARKKSLASNSDDEIDEAMSYRTKDSDEISSASRSSGLLKTKATPQDTKQKWAPPKRKSLLDGSDSEEELKSEGRKSPKSDKSDKSYKLNPLEKKPGGTPKESPVPTPRRNPKPGESPFLDDLIAGSKSPKSPKELRKTEIPGSPPRSRASSNGQQSPKLAPLSSDKSSRPQSRATSKDSIAEDIHDSSPRSLSSSSRARSPMLDPFARSPPVGKRSPLGLKDSLDEADGKKSQWPPLKGKPSELPKKDDKKPAAVPRRGLAKNDDDSDEDAFKSHKPPQKKDPLSFLHDDSRPSPRNQSLSPKDRFNKEKDKSPELPRPRGALARDGSHGSSKDEKEERRFGVKDKSKLSDDESPRSRSQSGSSSKDRFKEKEKTPELPRRGLMKRDDSDDDEKGKSRFGLKGKSKFGHDEPDPLPRRDKEHEKKPDFMRRTSLKKEDSDSEKEVKKPEHQRKSRRDQDDPSRERDSSLLRELEEDPEKKERLEKEMEEKLARVGQDTDTRGKAGLTVAIDSVNVRNEGAANDALHRSQSKEDLSSTSKPKKSTKTLTKTFGSMPRLDAWKAKAKPRIETRPTTALGHQPTDSMSFDDTNSIRSAVYEEWYRTKLKDAKEKLKEKKMTDKEKEQQKLKEESDKKAEAETNFRIWKERKDEYLKEKYAKEKRKKNTLAKKEKSEKSDKKEDSQKAFDSWKLEMDKKIKDELRKKKKKEEEKQNAKEKLEQEKKKQAESSFAAWKEKKDVVLSKQQTEEQKKLSATQRQKQDEEEKKEREARERYDKWMEETEKRKKEDRRRQQERERLMEEEPIPAFRPAGKTIPTGR